MEAITIGTRTINPNNTEHDFFRAVIEERKALPKSHPHYLLLKIIANALYGIFGELNKYEYGKNSAKKLKVFSGDDQFEQTDTVVERPGRWQFPPAAALITAGGRLMLAILENMVEQRGGTYLLTDTDSMLFVASEKGGLVPCSGGSHTSVDGSPSIKAISWNDVREICSELHPLNPYDPARVAEILKIEDCNYDRAEEPHQLHGLAVSAKRYVVYKRNKNDFEIIKPSEHGLGIVFVPDDRKPNRYKSTDCKDQETDYPLWVVESWEQLLTDHFRNIDNPENALVSGELWFANFPAMMRVRVTTPNVMEALRRRDPGAAKPYNFALSPILLEPPDCTLVTPFTKNPNEWLTRPYTEIHSGAIIHLDGDYQGNKIVHQAFRGILWRHYLHPEDKSLAPDGSPCRPYTSGLLLRRPIQATLPFNFIGKEIERREQEGEEISVLENKGPLRYEARQTLRTRAADPRWILRARKFSSRKIVRTSGCGQHTVERFMRNERLHPGTRARIQRAVEELENKKR